MTPPPAVSRPLAAPERTEPAAVAPAGPPVGPPPGRPVEMPPPPPATDQPAVRQAGAVVLVRDKVALRKAKDGTWVLPKGHLEKGETLEQAALREVAEEMGLAGVLGDQIDDLRFVQAGQPRHVTYFLFRAGRPLPSWTNHLGRDTFLFSPAEAVSRLTHDAARRLLEKALETDRASR